MAACACFFLMKANVSGMEVSCYYDEQDKCFLLIRNIRKVEVSQVFFMDNLKPSQWNKSNANYSIMIAEGALPFYQKIMFLADVLCQTFTDKKRAEEFMSKLQSLPDKDKPRWVKNCLLEIPGNKQGEYVGEKITDEERKRAKKRE
ncbi:hypothetical protein [uncultured Akkermansia sp.]|uniref:hypothetical protein n=1 Tax=Akkermansia sp. TaxID=1872421 RepID=UPI0025F9A366|nr:hypothetical protein [uncultured Akkermansia sp.]